LKPAVMWHAVFLMPEWRRCT